MGIYIDMFTKKRIPQPKVQCNEKTRKITNIKVLSDEQLKQDLEEQIAYGIPLTESGQQMYIDVSMRLLRARTRKGKIEQRKRDLGIL